MAVMMMDFVLFFRWYHTLVFWRQSWMPSHLYAQATPPGSSDAHHVHAVLFLKGPRAVLLFNPPRVKNEQIFIVGRAHSILYATHLQTWQHCRLKLPHRRGFCLESRWINIQCLKPLPTFTKYWFMHTLTHEIMYHVHIAQIHEIVPSMIDSE